MKEKNTVYSEKGMRSKGFIVPLIALLCFLSGVFLFSVDAQAYQIKRVLRGNIPVTTGTETITYDLVASGGFSELNTDPLDVNKSFILFTTTNTAARDTRDRTDFIVTIDGATTLLVTRRSGNTCASNIEYMVVEFASGVTVYAGMTTVADSAATKVIAFTTSPGITVSKAFPLLSFRVGGGVANSTDDKNIFTAEITSTTQLTIIRAEAVSGDNYNTDVAYQVVAFDSTEQDINVQKGTATINLGQGAGETYDDGVVMKASIPTAVNTARSLLLFTVMPATGASGGYENLYMVDGQITGVSELTFTRACVATNSSTTVKWHVVEFKNNVANVQAGRKAPNPTNSLTLSAGPGADGFTTAVYANRCFAVRSVSGGGNADNDSSGLSSSYWRVNFNAAAGSPPTCTTLNFTRTGANTNTTVSYFIAELPPLNIKYPNGGENALKVGDTINVQWEHSKELETLGTFGGAGTAVKVKLLVDKNGGNSGYPVVLAQHLSAAVNQYSWDTNTTPDLISNNLRIRIQCEETFTDSTRNYDDSNGSFELKGDIILNAPDASVNASSPWLVNDPTTRNIQWTPKGTLTTLGTIGAGTVRIEYSSDGSTWETLVNPVNVGDHNVPQSWPWSINSLSPNNKNTIGEDNLIKVSLNSNTGTAVTLSSSTNNGAPGNLVKITSATNHNLTTGDMVSIIGHNIPYVNSNWQVTAVNATDFTLDGSVYQGVDGTAGGTIRKIVTVADISTSVNNSSPVNISASSNGGSTVAISSSTSSFSPVNISGSASSFAPVNISSSSNGGTTYAITGSVNNNTTAAISATANNASKPQFTVASTTGLSVNQWITVSGHACGAYNGNRQIFSVDSSTKFTINMAYSCTGTGNYATWGLVKVTTASTTGLANGNSVTIPGHNIAGVNGD